MVSERVPGRKRLITTSPVYFGGVPPTYRLSKENIPTMHRFIGCIGDVTMQGRYVVSTPIGFFLTMCAVVVKLVRCTPLLVGLYTEEKIITELSK